MPNFMKQTLLHGYEYGYETFEYYRSMKNNSAGLHNFENCIPKPEFYS